MTTAVDSNSRRRRRWTPEQKRQIVEECRTGSARVAEVARQHDLHPNLIRTWLRQGSSASQHPKNGPARFVPVTIAASAAGERTTNVGGVRGEIAVEVMLRNGRLLRMPECVTPVRAGALADALEGVAR